MGHHLGLRFAAGLLTAIAMASGLAHLFAFLNKMNLSGSDYFIAQRAYDGWALLGIVQVAAIASVIWLAAVLAPDPGRRWAWASAGLMVVGLVVFFGRI